MVEVVDRVRGYRHRCVAAPRLVDATMVREIGHTFVCTVRLGIARQPRERRKHRMTHIPSGTEVARPFVPAGDLDVSKRFYITLGFEIVLDADDVAIFRIGTSSFLLTRFDRAEHFMMQLMVEDLDAWWARITTLQLTRAFGVPEPRPPAMQPWGLRVAYVVDPSGVLWHVAQRRPSVPHDA